MQLCCFRLQDAFPFRNSLLPIASAFYDTSIRNMVLKPAEWYHGVGLVSKINVIQMDHTLR